MTSYANACRQIMANPTNQTLISTFIRQASRHPDLDMPAGVLPANLADALMLVATTCSGRYSEIMVGDAAWKDHVTWHKSAFLKLLGRENCIITDGVLLLRTTEPITGSLVTDSGPGETHLVFRQCED